MLYMLTTSSRNRNFSKAILASTAAALPSSLLDAPPGPLPVPAFAAVLRLLSLPLLEEKPPFMLAPEVNLLLLELIPLAPNFPLALLPFAPKAALSIPAARIAASALSRATLNFLLLPPRLVVWREKVRPRELPWAVPGRLRTPRVEPNMIASPTRK